MDQIKLATCDIGPTHSEASASLPASAETPARTQDSADIAEPINAVEAVRYLFLAKELRRLGQGHAADRWQAKATAWLQRLSSRENE